MNLSVESTEVLIPHKIGVLVITSVTVYSLIVRSNAQFIICNHRQQMHQFNAQLCVYTF